MRERLRVLHCLPWLTSGGVERRRLELARRLDPERFDQRIVCLTARADFLEKFEKTPTIVRRLDLPLGPSALRRIATVARPFRPHIVHGAVFEGNMMATAAALATGSRLILEETGHTFRRSWRGTLLFRALAARADVCVGVSPAVVEYLRDVARLPAPKVRLVMNGISAPQLRTAERVQIREELSIPNDALVVGSIGRLSNWHKRFTDLLVAMHELRHAHPNAHLLIVGEGSDRAMLEAKRDALGLSRHVTFSGYQSDVGRMLSVMDVFALASEGESFGLVLVEAMFAGLPVVATRSFGIPSIVLDGETGFLVPVEDPAAIAAALSRLLNDQSLCRRLGAAGLQRARAEFSAERYVADVEGLYLDVGRPRPKRSLLESALAIGRNPLHTNTEDRGSP